MRVLPDTNVLVAAFATRGLCHDLFRTVLADHTLLVGSTNLEEFRRALDRKLRMEPGRVGKSVEFVQRNAEAIVPSGPACWPESDPDDRSVVAAALEGRADVLVTGDKGLIEAAETRALSVLSPREFWESLHDAER